MFLNRLKSFFNWTKNPEDQSRKTGIIKYFNRTRGFGFIRSKQTQKEVFVHVNDAVDQISKGDKVQFEVEKDQKGLRAVNVELVDSTAVG